jgi:(R,R)-butanediol dehydrogenase/meso-butanediol dehydrogenase/diacetyl reductase
MGERRDRDRHRRTAPQLERHEMRAAVFQGPGKPLSIENVDDPKPGPGEIVLRVAGCGICGSDLHMSEQTMPAGMVMGHEFAGEIVEVGRDAGDWKVGDRVCSLPMFGCGKCLWCQTGTTQFCRELRGTGLGPLPGAYAEYVLASAAETLRLPDSVPTHEGALVEPLAVGLHVVHAARVTAGNNVLILGAGPVGLATALWAHHVGAREVIVSDFVASRRELVSRFGATGVIDPSREEVGPAFRRLTGHAPDIIIECVGVPGVIQETFELARPRCRVVIAGVCMKPDTIVPLTAVMKELDVQFVSFYERADFAYTLDMLRAERIAPRGMITDLIGLDELPQAFEALRKPSTQCKVIIQP